MTIFSVKINDKVKKITNHVLAWLVIFFVNLIDFQDYSIHLNFVKFNLPTFLTNIALFYFSYLILVPKFLFKKRGVYFTILSFCALTLSFITIRHSYQMSRYDAISAIVLEDIAKIKSENKEDKKIKATTSSGYRDPLYREFLRENLRLSEDKVAENLKSFIFGARQYEPFHPKNAMIIYGLLSVWLISIVICFFERQKEEESHRQELEKEKIIAELEYLKQQINPHFLFNALNSIYSLTILNSPQSSDAVLKLSSILRYMLYQSNKNRVPLSDEIAVIENYLGLQQLRLTDNCKIEFKKEGDTSKHSIEPMLLIPLIENSFKYGINSAMPSTIEIELKVNSEKIEFRCTNKIVNQNTDSSSSGIGIKNIQRRLELIYGTNHTFTKRTDGDFFTVELILNNSTIG